MKLIKFAIFEANDGEVVSGTITKQRRRGDAWIVEDSFTFITDGDQNKERVLLLADDQRLIIEGGANKKIIYDHPQVAARPVAVPRPRPVTAVPADAEESPRIPAVELAQTGSTFLADIERERRDRLITEARMRLKQMKPPESANGTGH